MITLTTLKSTLIYLMPGQLYIGRHPAIIRTILGSCLSMVFFSERHKVGAISHALLPQRCKRDRCLSGNIDSCLKGTVDEEFFKYVDCSTHFMLDTFNTMGVFKEELEVKIFGGADVLDTVHKGSGAISIGKSNIEMAKKLIEIEKLNLVAWDIGGGRGRKLVFNSFTGDVFVKKLDRNSEGNYTT